MTAIDGILLVDKQEGLSSNAVLQRAKRLLGAKKAGHTGSLDPLATGMLPICFGDATKFSQYLLDADKAYEVTGALGAVSSTGDAEGEIKPCVEQVNISESALKIVLEQLTGPIQQIPPMYSALKHQGKPLYTYARRGEVIERPPREVIIHDIKIRKFDAKSIHLTVKCSKGTYIRTLVESVGEMLGVGAYVTQLHRTYTAGFEQEPMWTLDALEAESLEARRTHLLLPERAVVQFPKLEVSLDVMQALYQGKIIAYLEQRLAPGIFRLYGPGHLFFGLGEITGDGDLKVKRLKADMPCFAG
ncbi:MAG: tRNA pseudouridine(55) synthase TruB [Legionella sp.]|nr:tRNA pseudouridine(55) synthase TruB [Legionella sp.]